jgi:hypothetical protein
MCTHGGAIEHHTLHIGVGGKVAQPFIPDTSFAPTSEAFVDRIPLPIFLGQETPLRPTARYPQHPFEEATALCFLTDVNAVVVP